MEALVLEDPSKVYLPSMNAKQRIEVDALLTYTDKKIIYEIQRHKQTGRYRFPEEEDWNAELARLKALQVVKLLQQDEQSRYWTWSGQTHALKRIFNQAWEVKKFTYPEPKLFPWAKEPDKTPYPYQLEALEKLLLWKHAGVEMGTGLGKSFIIALLIKRLGLKTLLMAPSTGIAEQLYEEFSKLFGARYVGPYFGRFKKPDKLIVIGNSQSLTRVEEGTSTYEALAKTEVFIADESHQCPAKSLSNVCFGVASKAPYRFFFSATQLRNDGSGPLLTGITGPIVYNMTVREGVDGGYLTRPKFHMMICPPNGTYYKKDAMAMTREHLFYNPAIIKYVGAVCNMAASQRRPILVLVEEMEQFTKLLPYLRHKAEFAHGPLNEDQKKRLPSPYWESDPNDQVRRFDAGEFPILVGTSCISTGTDVRSPQFLVYWQGLFSEIQVRQAVGRATRKFPGKETCHVIDFSVDNQMMTRHAKERQTIYDDLYGPVTREPLPGYNPGEID